MQEAKEEAAGDVILFVNFEHCHIPGAEAEMILRGD